MAEQKKKTKRKVTKKKSVVDSAARNAAMLTDELLKNKAENNEQAIEDFVQMRFHMIASRR